MEQQPSFESKESQRNGVIKLHFFRHSIKAKDDSVEDNDLPLSKEGRDLAKSMADTNTNIDQSIAYGSPRVRTQETSMLKMVGDSIGDLDDVDVVEMRERLDEGRTFGSKLGIDDDLDFKDSEVSKEISDELGNAYNEGTYVQYIVEKSDQRLQETGQEDKEGYTKKAAKIASIIERYTRSLSRWDQLVNEKTDYKPELERFFGTHQGIPESFLAKVIEKTKGIEERGVFLETMKKGGFDFVEGFDITIDSSKHDNIRIVIDFVGKDGYEFHEEISEEDLHNIAEMN